MLTPSRKRSREILDTPGANPSLAIRSLQDVARSNSLFGGTRAVMLELERVFVSASDSPMTLVDVGSGIGDIPRTARTAAAKRGAAVSTIAVEIDPMLARAARANCGDAVCGDALALPFATSSVDVVICSQVLHHFEDADATLVLREMDRVARRRVIIADLRRSWVAMAGLWLGSFPLGFHPVSRHDGVVSIRRGYTADELHDTIRSATGQTPDVSRHLGFRLTASWIPSRFAT